MKMSARDKIWFVEIVAMMMTAVHESAREHGFWDEGRNVAHDMDANRQPIVVKERPWNFGEKIALMHSELSEALEKHRATLGKGLPPEPDEHCPNFDGIAIEFADVIIRIFDVCQKMGIKLPEAIVAKAEFNYSRPYKHGKAY